MKNISGLFGRKDDGILVNPETSNINKDPLQYLPVGIFGSTVALSGLAIAWRLSEALFGTPAFISNLISIISWAAFLILTAAYLYKIIKFPDRVRAELIHPVSVNFLGTFFISAVLLSSLAASYSLLLARITWIVGTLGGIGFMYILTTRLFKGALNSLDLVPPTLIPGLTVLNAVSAHANIDLGWWGDEADQMLFSIGIVYVMVFFVIITYRLVHLEPLVLFLRPTLLLMSAPFEIGFLSYVSTKTQVDAFAAVLFYFGLFIFIVLFFVVFDKKLPYMVSWWGACFSMGALTNAALQYTKLSRLPVIRNMSFVLLVALTILIVITLLHTIRYLVTGRLLKP
jgi:tellurite resistance protein